MAKKKKEEQEKRLTKENARHVPQIIDISEDCTMTLVNENLENVGTVVVVKNKISLYDGETEPQEFKDFDELLDYVNDNDLNFCEDLAAKVGVGAVPGSSFFREPVNHLIRFHFAKNDETLNEALNRLERIRILKK